MDNWTSQLYQQNEQFHRYVDRYMKQYGLGLNVALQHKLVQEVGEYYQCKKQSHTVDAL